MNNANKLKFITFVGYFWLSITVIWTMYEIIDRSFSVTDMVPSRFKFLIMVGIVLLAIMIAVVLFTLYPILLENIFSKRSEREKYYQITDNDESAFGNTLINSYLNYLPDELSLLSPLCNIIGKQDFERAAKFGVWSSSILLRMENHLLRCINGLYTLYALHKWEQQTSDRTSKDRIAYMRYGVLINDLGWSLYKLSDSQYTRLLTFLKEHINELNNIMVVQGLLDTDKSHRAYAEMQLKRLQKELGQKKDFSLLRCQALRHLLSLDSTKREVYRQYADLFRECIKTIPNKRDKAEMKANYAFWNAQQCLAICELDEAAKGLESAKDLYKSINDDYRYVKTFYLQGQIYQRRAESEVAGERHNELLRLAFKTYGDGVAESECIARYDEYIKNCFAAVKIAIELGFSSEKYKCFEEKGLKAARLVRNDAMEKEFERLHCIKHIILLRHGESQKNIRKIINGVGSLTAQGQKLVAERAGEIFDYLNARGLADEQVHIYGHHKPQVKETIEILRRNIPNSEIHDDEVRLRPTHMGILSEKSEKDLFEQQHFIELERWRNISIPMRELHIPEMEQPDDFWARVEEFLKEIEDNGCSIIVCTTSIAILLTHMLLGNDVKSDRYTCIDIPLCGMIHFRKDFDEHELCNRDNLTNISFSELENLEGR